VQDTVSTLTIAESGTITSLALALNISHDRPSDLSAELRAPNRESRVLFAPGGFDRQFTVSFPEGVALAGDWVLILRDHVRQVAGTLNQWTIQVQVPQ
jgi:subtilisin-like proprotein convertase family protein